jgi:hypothetical protein
MASNRLALQSTQAENAELRAKLKAAETEVRSHHFFGLSCETSNLILWPSARRRKGFEKG